MKKYLGEGFDALFEILCVLGDLGALSWDLGFWGDSPREIAGINTAHGINL